jgi:predicted nucleotidyltransferase component of viral defense system
MKLEDLKGTRYFREAKLMLETLPSVATEKCFALKGGTAINFFVRDMPRLSVDIDLTYLPIEARTPSLENISEALKRIATRITKLRPSVQVGHILLSKTKYVTKLSVTEKDIKIKIEPNLVLRGTVFPTRTRKTAKSVEQFFEMAASITTVADADLYGGKLCAALDRQHPRDLFDVKLLLENEGITDEIRKGFVVYLAGHDETMSELLNPKLKELTQTFEEEFQGMPIESVTLKDLESTRTQLIAMLLRDLTDTERRFLLSIKEGDPKWELLGAAGAEQLPAIQWKLMKIKKMKPEHHRQSVQRLRAILSL